MNNVNLIGRLTRDPELRYTSSSMAVVRFTLAVERRMTKEKRMEAEAKNQPTADFISCTAWGKTAETINNYVKKGHRLGVEGRIQTGSYEKDGQRFYTTDVVVNNMEFLETVQGGGMRNTQNQGFRSQDSFGGNYPQDDIPDGGFFPVNNEDIPF